MRRCSALLAVHDQSRSICTQQAREISKVGVFYDTVEETLAKNGFAPNAQGRQQGYLRKVA